MQSACDGQYKEKWRQIARTYVTDQINEATNVTDGCKQHVDILHTAKMEELAHTYEEKLQDHKMTYEGGFNLSTNHANQVYRQTLKEGQAAIEHMRMETQKTVESLYAQAINAKNAEAREVFNRQRADAVQMQEQVARLEAHTKCFE